MFIFIVYAVTGEFTGFGDFIAQFLGGKENLQSAIDANSCGYPGPEINHRYVKKHCKKIKLQQLLAFHLDFIFYNMNLY